METLSINFPITDSPANLTILDRDMNFIGYSQAWLQAFFPNQGSIVGRSYYDILPETPEEIRKIHSDCLTGKSNRNDGKKFNYPNGTFQWLKWKINPWKDENGEVGGLIMVEEDITETKRREELLKKAEYVARIGGWEVDLLNNKVYWTQVTKEIHEVTDVYEPNIEEGINFYKVGHHRNEITRLVSEAIRDGVSWDTELIIVTAKGNEVWVRSKGEVETLDGKCLRIYGTFQDIDKSKKTALNFLETSERLAFATNKANVGIWDYDLIANKLVWDDNMYRLYGVDKKEFGDVFEAWHSCLHPEDKLRWRKEQEMFISGEKDYDTELRIIWPNGEIRHIKATAMVLRDDKGNALKMIGTNWDITELKTTQMLLKKSKESFIGAFESSNIGMALVGLDGKWMKVNHSLCNSLGYSEKELMQKTFQDLTHPDDLDKDLTFLNELNKGKKDGYQIEKRYYHKNGRIVYIILAVTAVKKVNGEISHFISQIMDITPRINAEKKLTRLVAITTEQNESLMNFAHIVSHNLRSHSSNLSMLSGFLCAEENENERKNLVDMLCDASESLNETVLHLNEVVQVKVDALNKMKRVNLYQTIMNVEKNLGLLLQEKNAVCHVNIDKQLKIQGITAYLDSIFLNLLTNSIKYSSPDRTPIIKISSKHMEDMTVVTFSDNGLGIDLKRHGDKLFGMYKTFHRNKDAKGIGLFITKNQIEAMGGRIEVESNVNVGTTFKLYFESGSS